MFGRPRLELFVGKLDGNGTLSVNFGNLLVTVLDNKRYRLVKITIGFNDYARLVVYGGDCQRLYVFRRYAFQPNRLPNTALRSVPHSAAVRALLAVGVVFGIGEIDNLYHKTVWRFFVN